MNILFEWGDYNHFPYEADFAALEVERLLQMSPREDADGLVVPSEHFDPAIARRFTYFKRIVGPNGDVIVPDQARMEASATNGNAKRQSTRYSAHGLHEYKGKFNPQVVRAIGNILGLTEQQHVLDPFCGSGTTLLECAHVGWHAVGIDRNPLAVKIANAKIRAFERARNDGFLGNATDDLVHRLLEAEEFLSTGYEVAPGLLRELLGDDWLTTLPSSEYLQAWFPAPVLAQVVLILRTIRDVVADPRDQSIFEVILSDQLRDASLQEPADLRIRRRKDPQPNYPILTWFLDAVRTRIGRVLQAGQERSDVKSQQLAHLGDICRLDLGSLEAAPAPGFDAVITSPPYVTALPYIDTQRLSLVALGMVDAENIRLTERSLIGDRELPRKEREEVESAIQARSDSTLPPSVYELCQDLLSAASLPGNGFRRQNRPALTFRYFRNMATFFRAVRGSMKPGAPVALVVGTNRTTLGGTEFVIETPNLLIDVAEWHGFRLQNARHMDTYPRYDLHQKNSINSETLIVLRS